MIARQHHYVPQCYLKSFVADRDKPRLFVVDAKERRAFLSNPANVAVERDFHRIDVAGHRPDVLESAFSQFEGQLDQALRRIVAARSVADENDRALLFNLIASVATKNPRRREQVRAFQDETAKKMMQMVASTPERWAAHVERIRAEGTSPDGPVPSYDEIREFVRRGQYDLVMTPADHLQVEWKIFDEILPYIFNRKWKTLRAPPGATGFITSDHPMCLNWTNPRERGGFWPPCLAVAETQVLFPVSNNLAIIGAFEFDESEQDADEILVASINGMIIANAERQVYARDDAFSYVMPPDPAVRRGARLLEDLIAERSKT